MTDEMGIHLWVERLADSVIQGAEADRYDDWWTGNNYALRGAAAIHKLRTLGGPAYDALATLLTHSRADVRVMAACYLLRHRTQESLQVLRTEAAEAGSTAFGASEAIKRWQEGEWHLDAESDLGDADEIWNRPILDYVRYARTSPAAGDRAVVPVLIVHGFVMNGGVLHAVESLDQTRIAAAISGYRFFGFHPVADLLSRVKGLLDAGPDAPSEEEQQELELLPGVTLVYEPAFDDGLEEQLDSEYLRYIPDDSALVQRFDQYLVSHPGDFARLSWPTA